MARSTSSRPLPEDGGPVVVAAPSLQTAHRRIRERFGDEAVILNTRSVTRRLEQGLGTERTVEVTVQPPGTARRPQPAPTNGGELPAELLREIERLEGLVEQVSADYERALNDQAWLQRDPLGGPLLAAGASVTVVRRTLARFAAAHGGRGGDPASLRAWLTSQLRASNCGWDGFYGCHAFLGDSGCGRSDLVLAAAARLQALGRRTLVLGVLPADPAYIHRLQEAAGEEGFDAAVLNEARKLVEAQAHFDGYDAVLVELPRLDHEAMRPGGILHGWLAPHTGFHRHLVIPADRDPADLPDPGRLARDWNCDWLAITRLDMTRRPGKLLDVLEATPLAVSLLGRNPRHGGDLAVGSSAAVAELVLPPRGAAAGRLDREVTR